MILDVDASGQYFSVPPLSHFFEMCQFDITDDLKKRMVVFVDDLKTFNEEILFQNYTDSSFMSETYFTDVEITMTELHSDKVLKLS